MAPPVILQDAVEQVADGLRKLSGGGGGSIELSSSLLGEAKQSLRVLEARVGIGKLGKFDRKENRAAVLIAYHVARQLGTTNTTSIGGSSDGNGGSAEGTRGDGRLSWKELGAVVGTKAINLEQLNAMIGNYLQQPVSQNSKKRRSADASASISNKRLSTEKSSTAGDPLQKTRSGRSHRYSSASSVASDSCHLMDLAIRLAAKIPDPHSAAKRAQIMLQAIRTYIQSHTNLHERRGYMYDLLRYESAYEAACLYHVVTSSHSSRPSATSASEKKIGKASKKRTQEAAYHNSTDVNDGEESDSGHNFPASADVFGSTHSAVLTIHDLADASNKFTYLELRQVLPEVVRLSQKARNIIKQEQATAQTKGKQSKIHTKMNNSTAAEKMLDPSFKYENAESTKTDNDRVTSSTSGFGKWKEQIISHAIEAAKEELSETDKNLKHDEKNHKESAVSPPVISDDIALERAADNVLRKFGLLV